MVKKWFEIEEEGELMRFGYKLSKKASSRHRALSRAIISKRNDGLEVFQKLWGLANVTQDSQPTNSKKYRADARWIKKRFYNTKYW